MADPFRLIFDVWQAARAPLARYLPAYDIAATDELLADRSGALTPRVMVFGTYNAGKSTLINALIGEEVARVADHPETDRVTSYPWRGFFLDDTPGIDAPIEHEQVTRAHLEASDAVLFVLATDGTLEEQRSFDEIIALVRASKPIRIILNNKSGYRPESPDFLSLSDRLAENLRRTAAAAGIADIEARAPIRLVNAASALRGRRENKSALLLNSGVMELEADIVELCEATGKLQMARTVGKRIATQVELCLSCMPLDDGIQPFRETADAVAAERVRLTAVLDQSAQEAAAVFQAALSHAVADGEPHRAQAASAEAADAVSAAIERELRKTRRLMNNILDAFDGHAGEIRPVSGSDIPLPEGAWREEEVKSEAFRFSDAARLLTPAISQVDKEAMIGGFMAAKQVFPVALKGLGPSFAGRLIPFVGPAIQAVTGVYDSIKAYRSEQREFERIKSRQVALAQQVADAGRKMRWALSQQCHRIIESIFAPAEDALARQRATLRSQATIVAADRAVLMKCKGRLEIE